MANASPKVVDYHAKAFVEHSCHLVIDALGVKMRAVPESHETVYLIGQLVALRTYEMARNTVAKGLAVCAGAVKAIGRFSVEFSISKSGETRAKVGRKARKKKSSKAVSSPEHTETDDDIEIDDAVVVKTKNGTKIIINNLNIYIKADSVAQMNVNPQIVQNILEERLDKLIEKTGK